MRISGIGAPELSAAKLAGENKKHSKRRSRSRGKQIEDITPTRLIEGVDSMVIDIPTESSISYCCVDGDPLPVLRGWLRKRSKRTRTWDRRYFYIEPEEKRLYYTQNGPIDDDHATGIYHSLAKVISSTYHKIIDGEDSTESWIDLRLIPDVELESKSKKNEKTCFDIDLGYRVMKIKCESEAQCRQWVNNLNRWREWAHSIANNGLLLSSGSKSGYSTDGSQYDSEDVRGRLPCEPESSSSRRRRMIRGKRAEDVDSRESSIASEDSEYGVSRHLEFLASPQARRFDSGDSVNSNVFASLSYYGDSDSRSRSDESTGRSTSRMRKFPGSTRSSESRLSESFDTARGGTAGSNWGEDEDDHKRSSSISNFNLEAEVNQRTNAPAVPLAIAEIKDLGELKALLPSASLIPPAKEVFEPDSHTCQSSEDTNRQITLHSVKSDSQRKGDRKRSSKASVRKNNNVFPPQPDTDHNEHDASGSIRNDTFIPTLSLKYSEVTRLPRPITSPKMKRSTSGSLALHWKDYPTQLNLDADPTARDVDHPEEFFGV